MDFSFLKALAASVRSQVSSLKSQSKRLHTASLKLFGQAYPIEVCREAVAVANGYRSWREVQNLAANVGQDKSLPAWHIHNRTDLHEACLKALIQTDVEMSESHPVVMLGPLENAALPAVCLWIEQISHRKVPGCIVIETNEATFQKTHVGQAAKALGLADLFQRFRVIDAREPSIALAMTGTAMEWIDALSEAFTEEQWKKLESTNVRVHFEYLIAELARQRGAADGYSDFGSYVLGTACTVLRNPGIIYNQLHHHDKEKGSRYDFLETRFEQDVMSCPRETLDAFIEVVEATQARLSDVGILLQFESLHRPTVVLCNTEDRVSMVLARLVRGMYLNRFVSDRSIRPLLFCGISDKPTLPKLLEFGTETVMLNGETDMRSPIWNTYRTSSPLFVTAAADSLIVSGKLATIQPALSQTAKSTPYESDVVAWANEQSALIRAGQFDKLDLVHVAEEIADVGKSEQTELAKRMATLLMLLLKLENLPIASENSSLAAIREQQRLIGRRIEKTPSLQKCLSDSDWREDIWLDARNQATKETGIEFDKFPVICPWALEHVARPGWLPVTLCI